jgi:hypothetical protein
MSLRAQAVDGCRFPKEVKSIGLVSGSVSLLSSVGFHRLIRRSTFCKLVFRHAVTSKVSWAPSSQLTRAHLPAFQGSTVDTHA